MEIKWTDYVLLIISICIVISILAENPYIKIGFAIIELLIALITMIVTEVENKKIEKDLKEKIEKIKGEKKDDTI